MLHLKVILGKIDIFQKASLLKVQKAGVILL